jgi:hypothetical protein
MKLCALFLWQCKKGLRISRSGKGGREIRYVRATACPYICLTVCCMAITLPCEDSVAWLVGSRSNSTW